MSARSRSHVVEDDLVPGQDVEKLTCSMCCDLFKDPVFIPTLCQCVFCDKCLSDYLRQGGKRCPRCNVPLPTKAEPKPFRWAKNDLDNLRVKCPNRCRWTGSFEARSRHITECPMARLDKELSAVEKRLEANLTEEQGLQARFFDGNKELEQVKKDREAKQEELKALERRKDQIVKDLRQLNQEEDRLSEDQKRVEQRRAELGQDKCGLQSRRDVLQQEKQAQTLGPDEQADPNLQRLLLAQAELEKAKQAIKEMEARLQEEQSNNQKAKRQRHDPPQQVQPRPIDIALLEAIKAGDVEEARRLLQAGADSNASNENGQTALHWAAMSHEVGTSKMLVEILVKAQADVNAKNTYGSTPLVIAANKDNLRTVRYLVKAGANPNIADKGGRTALRLAEENGFIEMTNFLRSAGVQQGNLERVALEDL